MLSAGVFTLLMLCQWTGRKETGRQHTWNRWPELIKKILHTIEPHAQHLNWGMYLEGEQIWTQEGGSGIHQHLVRASASFVFYLITVIIMFCHYYCTCTLFLLIKLVLPQNLQFYWSSSPFHWIWGEEGSWVSSCVGLNFQLGLNHHSKTAANNNPSIYLQFWT